MRRPCHLRHCLRYCRRNKHHHRVAGPIDICVSAVRPGARCNSGRRGGAAGTAYTPSTGPLGIAARATSSVGTRTGRTARRTHIRARQGRAAGKTITCPHAAAVTAIRSRAACGVAGGCECQRRRTRSSNARITAAVRQSRRTHQQQWNWCSDKKPSYRSRTAWMMRCHLRRPCRLRDSRFRTTNRRFRQRRTGSDITGQSSSRR